MLKKFLAREMVKHTVKRRFPIEFLEQKQVNKNNPYPNDSSFFYGGDSKGNAFITRMAFREPEKSNEYGFDCYLAGLGYFGLTVSPGEEGTGFRQGALRWIPVKTGYTWRILFEGTLIDRNEKAHYCNTNLLFTGDQPIYEFEKSYDIRTIANAIAAEKWTKKFFHQMKSAQMIHYEQTGMLTGKILLDETPVKLTMQGRRGHSFGSFNWDDRDRHYKMTGTSAEGFHWSVTSNRWKFMNHLTVGFITHPDGSTDAIVDCPDEAAILNGKRFPDHGKISMTTRSGKIHHLEFLLKNEFNYLHDGKYGVKLGIGECRFDGDEGIGLVEFGYDLDRAGPLPAR